MLDNASTSNFITKSLSKQLGLVTKTANIQIHGFGNSGAGSANALVDLTLSPHFDTSEQYFIKAFVVPTISGVQPEKRVNFRKWSHLKNLQLADPAFYIPADIDILIGAEHYYEIVDGDKKMDTPHTPMAINSAFGWLIGGGLSGTSAEVVHINHIQVQSSEDSLLDLNNQSLNETLKQFWEIESSPATKVLSSDEQFCEQHFGQTFRRDETGRFIVKYPFKSSPTQLGESLLIAIRRFKSIERRLALPQNEAYTKDYCKFMQDYENLGHMVEVPPPTAASKFRCYLPHHFVLKESSSTTKLRVVFDASAHTSNGVSLNSIMHSGPNIQDSIASLIMRFRKHKFVFTADIEKMYRQVLIHPDDQELQHIVWRESPDKALKHYKLLTITYGTAAGPYLATKVLQTLADMEAIHFPIASKVLREDFYIDDCMSGEETEEDTIVLQQQLIELLGTGGLSIKKFTSNSEKVLQSLPEDLRETKSLSLDKEAGIKALGIFWNPSEDFFGFKTETLSKKAYTIQKSKRQILSEISMLFDPIGWLSPIIIKAKILMQSIWKENITWDDPVPTHITRQWDTFQSELADLQQLKIPRHQVCMETESRSSYLMGFSDASEKAYCAAIFLCTYDETEGNTVSLVTAKTRVAPIKTQSLPRLELCGSLLLAELMPTVVKALSIKLTDTYAYTDSTLTLGWITSEPYKFKTFIANRITGITDTVLKSDKWGFVSGVDNPADCGSRGISVLDLLNHALWWNGSPWLKKTPVNIVSIPKPLPIEENLMEIRKVTVLHTSSNQFIKKLKLAVKRKKNPEIVTVEDNVNWLTTEELQESLLKLINVSQEQTFAIEMQCLRDGELLPRNSKILSLAPFLDDKNILRVGGRLRHARISSHQKHPVFLSNSHPLTSLIIAQEHIVQLHASPGSLLTALQQRYWIHRGKDVIRKIIRGCVTCTRHRAITMQQLMADLPDFRVNPSSPFLKTGIDYAGPFLIKPIAARSKTTIKAYICIFICCATKAIHLEVVSNATTAAFLAALRRFTARRGKPSDIYSDNGTNFVGADNEIQEFVKIMKSEKHNNEVAVTMSKDGIKWHYNPPAAPNFGGLWEAGVKSTKFHLKRVMGLNRLTFEELTTLTTQIEAILNSRPLTPESTDPNDMRALTPGHFLIGKPITAIPDPDLKDIPTNRLVRWQIIQQLTQQFWKRWSSEYITRLQQRPKWMQPVESISVGNLVIVKAENVPVLQWKLGRVTEVHAGTDGLVRTVTVKTAHGDYKRPIVKLCLLPVY